MRNGRVPARSRLRLAAANSSFSAAESSPEDDPAAEFDGGVGCLWLASGLGNSTACGVACAAHGPEITANIANETAMARSIIYVVGVSAQGSPVKLRFPSVKLTSRIQYNHLLWRPYCWLPCSLE